MRTQVSCSALAFGLSLFAFSTAWADAMPPGTASTAFASTTRSLEKQNRAIASENVVVLDFGKAKSTSAAREGLNAIAVGRVLPEAADIAGMSWSISEDGSRTLVVRAVSTGAAELRVGLQFRVVPDSLRIRVAPSSDESRVQTVSPDLIASSATVGIVWTPPTEGDSQLVEFTIAEPDAFPEQTAFVIGVSHFDIPSASVKNPLSKGLGAALSCQIDVACVSSIQDLDAVTRKAFENKVHSTALMTVTGSDGTSWTCTGTLLNNDYHTTNFLSANHCIGSAAEANSLVTTWGFERATCTGNTYYAGEKRASGAILLGTRQPVDSTLVGLRDLPPSDAVLSGWEANGAVASGTLMLGMHHPHGDLKKTSIGTITGISGAFSIGGVQFQDSAFYTTNWLLGLVEPGSSGSGLFYQPPGKDFLALIGLLNSGPATNLSCNSAQTYVNKYARFDVFYPTVRRFMKKDYSDNYTDLWWNPSESGWGVNIQHQGETLFATWFTYDTNGQGMWLVMSAGEKIAPGVYEGALYRTTGTPFNLINGTQALDFPLVQVGTGRFTFSSRAAGVFSYTVNGSSGSKSITRQSFAAPATCEFSMSNRGSNSNYQDLWFNPNEAGWGLNITHQGDVLFGTWFTYDSSRAGMWLVMSNGVRVAPGVYQGTLFRTTGTPFNQINGSTAVNLPLTPVGTLTLSFSDGQTGTMTYTVNGLSGSKSIRRQVYDLPVTSCQ